MHRARSFASEAAKSSIGRRLLNNEQHFHEYARLLESQDEKESIRTWVNYKCSNSRIKLNKRQVKMFEKEAQVLLKLKQSAKTACIAT